MAQRVRSDKSKLANPSPSTWWVIQSMSLVWDPTIAVMPLS